MMKNLVVGLRSGMVEIVKDVKGEMDDLIDMVSFIGDSSAYLNIRRNVDDEVCMRAFVKDVEFIKLEEKKEEHQYYTHVAYAESADGTKHFSRIYRDTSKYIGIAFNMKSPEPPPYPSAYNWVEITPNSLLTKSNKNDII